MRVLVIDDSRAMRAILKKTLVAIGHDVTEAADGQQGLDAVAAHGPFDLALVDWNMPVLNGLEFISRVRTDNANDGMKLMMVTTEVEMSRISQALDAGATDYLMKPFTPASLQEKIECLLAA